MNLTLEDQLALAERGAYIEKCYLPVVKGDTTIEAMAESVLEIGPPSGASSRPITDSRPTSLRRRRTNRSSRDSVDTACPSQRSRR